MTPYDAWVTQNPQLGETLQTYFNTNKYLLTNTTFSATCEQQMRVGAIMEKGKTLTVLSALKAFAHIGELVV